MGCGREPMSWEQRNSHEEGAQGEVATVGTGTEASGPLSSSQAGGSRRNCPVGRSARPPADQTLGCALHCAWGRGSETVWGPKEESLNHQLFVLGDFKRTSSNRLWLTIKDSPTNLPSALLTHSHCPCVSLKMVTSKGWRLATKNSNQRGRTLLP